MSAGPQPSITSPSPEQVAQAVPRRTAWLVLGALLALTLTYLTIWTTYAAVHTYPRYEQLEPGERSAGQIHFRLTKLAVTEVAAGEDADSEDTPAPAGTVFVIATVEATVDAPVADPVCTLNLLGPGQRVWEQSLDAPRRQRPSYCDSDTTLQPGQPFELENVFQIPSGYADQIRGVVVPDPVSVQPEQVLVPITS